uniref:Metallo-beta-lactamase domain-containing protein n=1 Tax=Panagrolaimus sp. PS1159 TaxID=55785 RepID=A0AC35ERA0_9BILA
MASDHGFILEKISLNVFCIKEVITKLFMYFISGEDKSALIDTGSGIKKSLLEFIEEKKLLKPKQKIIVINTHNHAEQTGGNWRFSSIGKIGKAHCVEDLCASAADKKYTRSLDSTFDWQKL